MLTKRTWSGRRIPPDVAERLSLMETRTKLPRGVMGPRMVSPSRVISAESCEIVLCEVGADGTKAVTVDRIRRRGAATRRRGVIVELR